MTSTGSVKVAVIGAGPAGIGVADGLAKAGIGGVAIIERREKVGGMPALCRKKKGAPPTYILYTQMRPVFGERFAGMLAERLGRSGAEVLTDSQVSGLDAESKEITIVNPAKGRFSIRAEAVVFACGARERSAAERGWIYGKRTGRTIFSKNLLDLMDGNELSIGGRRAVLGSDVIGYASSAKLGATEPNAVSVIDSRRRPECNLPGRLYFGLWTKPRFEAAGEALSVAGDQAVTGLMLDGGREIGCDILTLSGSLVPNSELAMMAGMKVDPLTRRFTDSRGNLLAEAGFFAAGNVLGGFHGGQWCYYDGRRAARMVAKYLAQQ